MLKSVVQNVKAHRKHLLGIAAALWVCGITTAAVIAAVPDTDGTIHGCYRKTTGLTDAKGALRIVDGQSCNSSENPVNWNAGGNNSGSVVLKDTNGQVLGDLIDYVQLLNYDDPNPLLPQMSVYNHALNRVIRLSSAYSTNGQYKIEYGIWVNPVYQSTNCTGQAYLPVDTFNASMTAKTSLFHWNVDATKYAIIADNASGTPITYNSEQRELSCNPTDGPVTTQAYTPTMLNGLPFTTPIATPFKF